jgi:hypothetical protein
MLAPVVHRYRTQPSVVRSRHWRGDLAARSGIDELMMLAPAACVDMRPRHGGAPASARRPSGDVSVIETIEIRWFVAGPLPRDVRTWFVASDTVIDERCDRYLLDGRPDIGVKFRNGETLELKARLETGPAVKLTGGPDGVPEVWRKWTLADGVVERSPSQRWVDVDKWIGKRRFSPRGAELEYSPALDGGQGCDVEIVAVRVGNDTAWSFAFSAYGPRSDRVASIRAAWSGLLRTSAPAIHGGGIAIRIDRSLNMGYPEWLDRIGR